MSLSKPLHQGRRPELRYPSPLRYPGGKGKLANFLKLVLTDNSLLDCEYVELYAGGASVALSLLFEQYTSHVHINDLNPRIYGFWRAVLDQPEELCRRISRTRVSVNEWRRQREIYARGEADEADLAFATFFLNRTSRSGIIGGGVIGGLDQSGPWKLDARFDKTDLIRRIEKIGRFRSRITVTGIDAADYLQQRVPELERAFLYLDPPYYVKGAGLYQNFYRHDDHVAVASLVGQLDVPWVVSYDSAPQIERLYAAYSQLAYSLSYSARDRYQGDEVMFFAPGLNIPVADSPANLPRAALDARRLARSSERASATELA